jgi:hypothetical protein
LEVQKDVNMGELFEFVEALKHECESKSLLEA